MAQTVATQGLIRVDIESEVGTPDRPARVLVYDGDQLVVEVVAEVELKQGADSGYYHYVTLKKTECVTPEKPHHHEWDAVRDGPPPHWDKKCACGALGGITPEEAFAD